MRGYKRTSSINFSKENELRDKIDEIDKKIENLKGKDKNIMSKEEFERKYGEI